MDKEDKKAESIPFSDLVQELPEMEWNPVISKLRFFEQRSGYKNLNVKRTLQACYYKDGKEIWEDVPLIIDQ